MVEDVNLLDGDRHHVVIQFFGQARAVEVYIDGTLIVDECLSFGTSALFESARFVIGNDLDSGQIPDEFDPAQGINAVIDEFAIFNGVIGSFAIRRQAKVALETEQYASNLFTLAPRHYFQLDDSGEIAANDGNLPDQVGVYGNQVDRSSAPLVCESDLSIEMRKNVQSRVLFESFDTSTSSNFTYSMWVQGVEDGFSSLLGIAEPNVEDNDFLVGSVDGTLRIFINGDSFDFPDINLLDGTPHHLGIAFESNNILQVFVDGEFEASIEGDIGLVSNGIVLMALGQDFDIPNPPFGFDATQALDGKIDEFAIFNRMLTPAEFEILANREINDLQPNFCEYFSADGPNSSQTVTATLDPQEAKFFRVAYDGVHPIRLTASSTNINTKMGLFDCRGNLLAVNDDFGSGTNSRFEFLDLEHGVYVLAVADNAAEFVDTGFSVNSTSMATGSFDVQINTGARPPSIDRSFTVEGFGFSATQNENPANNGQVLIYQVTTDGASPLNLTAPTANIGLYDFLGNLILVNSEQVSISGMGTYFIAIGNSSTTFDSFFFFTSSSQVFGPFDVEITTDAANPPVVAGTFDIAGEGDIESDDFFLPANDFRFYEVVYDGASPLTVDTFGSNVDTQIGWFDEFGNLLAENNDAMGTLQSELRFVDLPPGTFYLAFAAFASNFAGGFEVVSNSELAGEVSLNLRTDSAVVLGDVNCDGVVNLLDVEPFVDVLSNGIFDAKADINQDGVVNLLDIEPFISILSGG